ncbi:MAG: DegV family protein [Coriobacteriia bacterium]|nr:DegV family protein [Coriobacteriia bacterium]
MITIVTDSSVCLKKAEAEALSVRLVPLNYTVDGQSYSESYSDHNGDFETLLRGSGAYSGAYTTSHPNLAAYLSCFEEELQKNNEVLCITISSRLSGAYSTAYASAKQTENKGIAVFDSLLTAGGLYLLVKEAKKLVEQGLGLGEILDVLPAIRDRISIAFSVEDMAPLRKSGRLGFVRMNVGTILNIKPILLCKDGAVVSDKVVRGNAEVIKSLVAKIDNNAREVVINYIGDNHLASNLYHVAAEAFPQTKITLQKVGPVLGIHLGLKVIAVSFIY